MCAYTVISHTCYYLSISPASWWRFAFSVVLSRVTEHRRRQTWAFVLARAQLNVRYVQAYTRKLTEPVVDSETSVSCPSCSMASLLCVPTHAGHSHHPRVGVADDEYECFVVLESIRYQVFLFYVGKLVRNTVRVHLCSWCSKGYNKCIHWFKH